MDTNSACQPGRIGLFAIRINVGQHGLRWVYHDLVIFVVLCKQLICYIFLLVCHVILYTHVLYQLHKLSFAYDQLLHYFFTIPGTVMASLDRPEVLSLPPAATPSSPLDNDHHDRSVLPVFDSNIGFYAPTQHPNQNESQTSFQQPLIQARNPFGGGGDTASIAPSIATSIPPPNNYTRATRYHGHSSEEEYLAALRAWAEEKQYVQLDKNGGLHGFYGHEELQERAQRMTKERRAAKEMKARMKVERRGTVAAPEGEGSATAVAAAAAAARSGGGRRRDSVANFFRRQSNAV